LSDAITREQACAFADAHYGPANGALVVSGNVTEDRVIASLKRFLARVARHDTAAAVRVPSVAAMARRIETSAPIDDPAVLLAWPLPRDPKERVEVETIARAARAAIDAEVKGQGIETTLGDDSAPMLAIVVEQASDETVDDVIAGAKLALWAVPAWLQRPAAESFGELAFDRLQQTAIYDTYASLESAAARNVQLATAVLDGHDPEQQLARTFEGLRALQPEEAARVAREHLGFDRATVAVLRPSDRKQGRELTVAAAIHDLGQRRDLPDPAEASRPAPTDRATVTGARTRTLPNGLRVVLLPVTSVPTVDIRLVFAAGTADEPAARRGAALVAAHGLTWDLRYLEDLVRFTAAGGSAEVAVGADTTTFATRGVDMHLDLLLAGLRRWVLDGTYEDLSERPGEVLRGEAKRVNDAGVLTDTWRAALYGAGHPYVAAGLVRRVAPELSAADVAAYRAGHFTPDNATLVIAGRFDAALADRWIDYLFGGWQGHALPRANAKASLMPSSVATAEATAQLRVAIALPATTGTHASRLVAAEMLDQVARDVRNQLGASYGVAASLDERRLAAQYTIEGWVDAARADDALKLLRERTDQLRSDPVAAARAFVVARHRALVQLATLSDTSRALAEEVEATIAAGTSGQDTTETAAAVRALTIDAMKSTLEELDLSRAAILMRGPHDDFTRALAVLGRTPTIVALHRAADDADDPVPAPAVARHESHSNLRSYDLEGALTDQGTPARLTMMAGAGYTFSNLSAPNQYLTYDCCGGPVFLGEVGFRAGADYALGLHLELGKYSGTYSGVLLPKTTLENTAYDIEAFVQVTGYQRFWAGFLAGAHLDHAIEATTMGPGPRSWQGALGIGIEGGVDVLVLGAERVGVWLKLDGALGSSSGYAGATFGAEYRHY
jgi:zinc protease